MKIPDTINGVFELGGSFAVLLSIISVLQSEQVSGVHWVTVLFFTTWGYWNIYYYKHLEQTFSWAAGICVTAANTIWVALLIYYT